MRTTMRFFAPTAVLLFAATASVAFAAEPFRVGPGGTHATIQAAIDAALAGGVEASRREPIEAASCCLDFSPLLASPRLASPQDVRPSTADFGERWVGARGRIAL